VAAALEKEVRRRRMPKSLHEVKVIFKTWDEDGSGTISLKELQHVMQRLAPGMREEDLAALLREADKNNNGLIEYEEFVDWLTLPTSGISINSGSASVFDLDSVLRPLFDVYDQDKSGTISLEELQNMQETLRNAVMASHDEDTVSELPIAFASDVGEWFDHDHDGNIGFEEFVEWQRQSLEASEVSQARLVELVQKLAVILQSVFMVRGVDHHQRDIGHHPSVVCNPLLDGLMKKVADASRELWGHHHEEEIKWLHEPETWEMIPKGMSVAALKKTHMRAKFPAKVKRIELEVHCVPDVRPKKQQGESAHWLALVVRHCHVANKEPEEHPFYYEYTGAKWMDTGHEGYEAAERALPAELRIFSLMLTEADFGSDMRWEQVQHALNCAVSMCFLTRSEVVRLNREASAFVTSHGADGQNLILETLHFTPLQVMFMLSEFRVVPASPLWASERLQL